MAEEEEEVMAPEYLLQQVMLKDLSKRLQAGQEMVELILQEDKCPDLEQDQGTLDRMVEALASSWVNSSHFKVVLLGMDLLSALVSRLQEKFRTQVGTVLPSLIDRLGDAKDQVRDQDQALLLKIMDQAANPQYVWERIMGGFKHKNNRTREGLCLCLNSTLNVFGSQSLTLSKIVPHICNLLGDPTSQVRDGAMSCLVEIYRHVGERVRIDLGKKGLPQSRLNVIFSKFDEVQRSGNMILSPVSDKNSEDGDSLDGGCSSSSSKGELLAGRKTGVGSLRRPVSKSAGRDGSTAGAVDEADFIQAFDDVPTMQIYSNREVEEAMVKIRDVLSDDKRDWELRVAALKKVRSLMLAGAAEFDGFPQQLRLLESAFVLSAKDLRSQVVREACITLGYLSSVLGSRFDHAAEAVMPSLLNLVPNSAKVMATSGVAAIRLILKHTHYPRLIPIITSNCISKSVAVRRRCYDLLDLQLKEWHTNSLERHVAVLMETLKKGIHDADAEVRSVARKCYWNFQSHFSREAEQLFQRLESSYQKALQAHLRSGDTLMSLPPSDHSSSSSQESLNRTLSPRSNTGRNVAKPKASKSSRPPTGTSSPGTLQRSCSDVDVNAAASARTRMPTVASAVQASPLSFSSASALPPGSYASLGRVRTQKTSAGKRPSVPDGRGRSKGKVVSQSQPGSRSGSPGRMLGSTHGRMVRVPVGNSPVPASSGLSNSRRPRGHRSQGCSRETSPTRSGSARSRIPRLSMSQGCSRETSRESSRDTSPSRGFSPLDRLSHQARISASVNAMRILNTGTEVEAAVADALLLGESRSKQRSARRHFESPGMFSDDDANSDASSACSERSYGSRNGAVRHTDDVAEILNHCASANWSERKEGLLGLQNVLRSHIMLSRVELKRLCEIFTRMFADPHSKRVFSMFLETLVDFIVLHREDLLDWLFILLTQLLKKMGADLLGSVQAKVQKALDVTCESFPYEQQFNILMRFIVDQTQTPNLKVKVAILRYIEALARRMDPADFVNTSETRLAVSRIITWTTEPKSSDVRKHLFHSTNPQTLHNWEDLSGRAGTVASLPGEGNLEERCKQAAQVVLIALFELNTPEFTMLLGALPKTFQDGTTKLLHNHLRSTSGIAMASPGSSTGRTTPRQSSSRSSPLTSPTTYSQGGLSPSMLECDSENLNSEEIYSSLRGVTEAIQNFSFRSQEEHMELYKRDGMRDLGVEGGSPSHSNLKLYGDSMEAGRTALDNKTSLLNTPSPRSFTLQRFREYNPHNYDSMELRLNGRQHESAKNKIQNPRNIPGVTEQLVGELLKELSQGPAGECATEERSVEERRATLLELLKVSREDVQVVWDEHFKTMLLLLLEMLGDKDHMIRALSLRVLKEILRNQPGRFKNYAELTIMKTLEAHKDSHKEVVRASEEAASTLAGSIQPEQCIKVLCPIVQTADYPINLAAIKMQTRAVERITKEPLLQLLHDIIPGLLQGYDDTESSVRKASVFCLVAIYAVIGEELKPFLSQLTGSKMKLLNLYIKRAQTSTSNSSSSSDISSY
ncbi:CLIP-associating protein 1-A-like isoform X1 [Syngnathus acus]|uniref:CLIP-associating protein 1-A-like isoform X1 n=1 Tax=Syngnathus acus TaxID=161584 RepID=UPI00188632A6|nr:CLIP-associating protein 1-A-like isoform X1 [Syngnathus acus]XP_037131913.1 CLIP-associating protein 1-A-like isoform X1 [Syngnathus acus]XP_037131922.1 CLIP-associating protein 1-A-like isoform X1 [Syngnathus acus]